MTQRARTAQRQPAPLHAHRLPAQCVSRRAASRRVARACARRLLPRRLSPRPGAAPPALTGINCNSYRPAAGQPGNLAGKYAPYSCPTMTTQKGAVFHTYKLVWTPTWLAWLVDNVTYRNSTSSPWRPVTMRPLLRTNVGTAASVAALPSSSIYVRRIRYTPLTPAAAGTPGYPGYMPHWLDPVVTSALSCSSMAACYGSLSSSASGIIQMAGGVSAAAASRRRGRSLLQGAGPVLSCTNGTCNQVASSDSSSPSSFQAELASALAAAQASVAATLVRAHTRRSSYSKRGGRPWLTGAASLPPRVVRGRWTGTTTCCPRRCPSASAATR